MFNIFAIKLVVMLIVSVYTEQLVKGLGLEKNYIEALFLNFRVAFLKICGAFLAV